MKKNIIISVVAILVLISLLIFFGAWQGSKKSNTPLSVDKNTNHVDDGLPVSRVSSSTSVAIGWETYLNKDLGFSIDYPKNFIVKENISSTSVSVYFGDKETVKAGSGEISFYGPVEYSSFDAYFKDVQDAYKINKKVKINGDEAVFFSFTFANEAKYEKRLVIKHNNKFWTISIFCFNEDYRKITENLPRSEADNLLSLEDYGRVTNSFKFLK